MQYKPIRAIISGGGTGGHIFPAVSIANKLKELNPDTEILFVGAEGKMEMEKVPAEGYKIVGLPMVGMQRQLSMKNLMNNLTVPFRVLLGGRVQSICVAYEGMEKFFPKEKLVMSGNPIRAAVSQPATPAMKEEAMAYYHLDPSKQHLFVVGGSLGSGTLNRSMRHWIQDGCPGGENVEVIWQCGKYYKKDTDAFMAAQSNVKGITPYDFIARMDLAYAAADVVISRSGASTVSELCAMGKATIFVPSPNVAEDHQTHNAMALVRKDAALLVKDSDAVDELLSTALALLQSPDRIKQLEKNAGKMALRNAAQVICDEVYKLV